MIDLSSDKIDLLRKILLLLFFIGLSLSSFSQNNTFRIKKISLKTLKKIRITESFDGCFSDYGKTYEVDIEDSLKMYDLNLN